MRHDPNQPLGSDFVAAVQVSLDRFLNTQRDLLAEAGDRISLIWDEASRFAQGGKRMRPGFCYWGYVAAAEEDAVAPDAVMDIAASLDLLHAFALVHDDLIDSSDTRRGGPSAHKYLEGFHESQGWLGDSTHFGQSAAIILGDILFAWSVSMVEQSGMPSDRLKRARPYLDSMRVEVLAGQFLDLIHQSRPASAADMVEDAELVLDFKTAKYTVARPVQIGAALAGASDGTLQGLGRFGAHVGHAFQMRDDMLGVFGDPLVMGKPAGDDVREGKKTVLIAYALRDASSKDAQRLMSMLGDPSLTQSDLDEARQILIDSGAVGATEKAIQSEAIAGMRQLHRLDLSSEGAYALMTLVHAAVERVA